MSEETNFSRLSNLGNTCYQNAVLHCMLHTPGGFMEYILSGEYLSYMKKKYSEEDIYKSLIFQYHRIANAIFKTDDIELSIHTFKKLVGKKNCIFEGYEQQDAQEFVGFIIDKFSEEVGMPLKYVPTIHVDNSSWSIKKKLLNLQADNSWERFNRRNYSLMTPLFNGQYRTRLSYGDSGAVKNNFTPFNTLQVQICDEEKTSLSECLTNMRKIENLDGDNMLMGDMCYGKKTVGSKQETIWKLGKYMVIQLKRFNYDYRTNTSTKNTALVDYPMEIDMSEYIDEESKYKDMKNIYKLYGVVLHLGMMHGGFSAGHYISLVRNRTDCNWYIYNDDHTPQKLKKDSLVNRNAYLLFYVRND